MRDTASPRMISGLGNRLWGQMYARVSKLTLITLGVILLCVAPLFFLMRQEYFGLALYRTFIPYGSTGMLSHGILVLLSSGIELFLATLAFLQYRVRRMPLLAVISLALFWSGLVDLAQVVIFEEWVHVVGREGQQSPLGWALARFFTASILVEAAGIVLYRSRQPNHRILSPRLLVGLFVGFGIMAALTVVWLLFGPLPPSLYPDSVVKRPWDIPALIVLLVGALIIFPRLHRRYKSIFSYALWLSLVPLIAAQCYLIFYSRELFDAGYLVAYGLVLGSFAVVSSGLAVDYLHVADHERRLVQELKVREARIRAVLENASEAIIMVDRDLKVQLWNPSAQEMFGYDEEEVLGQMFLKFVSSAAYEEFSLGRLQEILQKDEREQLNYARKVNLVRRSGESFVAEYTVALHWPDDEEGTDEEVGHMTFFIRDRTEQYQMRLRMIQMDRLITVGTLAAGVGHELSNPLTYVLAHLEMANDSLEQCGCGENPELLEVADSLKTIELGVERIRGIVQDLKLMSSFQETESHPVALQDAAKIAAKMTRHISSVNAVLLEEYAEVASVLADEARLTQVFINLITNAVQALPDRDAEENRIVIRIFQDENKVIAEVEDNGQGMTSEVLEKIFEQFFTTKAVGEGTGLGLALCAQIVESFDGRIEVDSVPGLGSTFRLIFPAYETTS